MDSRGAKSEARSWLVAILVLALMLCASVTAYAADSNSSSVDRAESSNEGLLAGGAISAQALGDEYALVSYFNPANSDSSQGPRPPKSSALACKIKSDASGNTKFINEEWYVVQGQQKLEGRLEIYGENVNIILAEKSTLAVHGGIFVRATTPSGKPCKLTIWGENENSTGTLNAGATWGNDDTLKDELKAGQKAGRAGAGIGAIPSQAGGDLVINGGVINAVGYEKSAGIGGSNRQAMRSVTINAGTVNARPGSLVGKDFEGGCGIGSGIYSPGFPITINGGTVKAQGGAAAAGIGGSMASSEASYDKNTYAGPITITGGTVTAIGGPKGAGIGSGWLLPSKKIEITGGAVTAAGYEGGAGIGGGNNEDGQGGRNWGAADLIKITGGTVKAYAYIARPTLDHSKVDFGLGPVNRLPRTEDAAGAGIGAGQHAHSGPIVIEGGDIYAWSSAWAAGIGGGSRGDFNSPLTVNGGKVVAIGGCSAAGIGGGFAGNQNASIYIRGGEVYAYAGVDWQRDYNNSTHGGAGIGGGKEDWYNTGGCAGGVFIEGDSKVVACGGSGFPVAIGIGYNETKELGTLNIADDMWVQWCAGCDLTPYDKSKGEMWLGKQREPISPDKLIPSNADLRVSDCKHMTYVLIEKCPHKYAQYVDIDEDNHLVNNTCIYCKGLQNVEYKHHDFNSDPAGHACVCGHKEYGVTFYDEDGTALKDTEWYVGGVDATTIAKPADPKREGYTFAGWYEKAGSDYAEDAYNFNGDVDKKLDLYAKWIQNAPAPTIMKYTVNFYKGDSQETLKTVQVDAGSRLTGDKMPPTPSGQEGQEFDGWYEKKSGEYAPVAFDFSQPITRNVDLYQKWSATPITFTVRFHPENGEANIPKTVAKDALATPLKSPSKVGFEFAGWYEKNGDTLSANPFNFQTAITKNLDLYAKWKEQTHLVEFDARGGEFPSGMFENPSRPYVSVRDNEKVDSSLLKEPTLEGYVFNGWYLAGSEEAYNFNDPVTKDIALVAQWTKAGNVPVVTAPIAKDLTYNGKAQELLEAGEVDGGFMHYALGTAKAPTGVIYSDVPTATDAGTYYVWYAVEGDALHANVDPKCVKVTIKKAGATVTAKSQTIKEGEKLKTGTGQVGVTGLLKGNILDSVNVASGTGSQDGKVVASAAKILDSEGYDVTENYDITYKAGTLTVRKAIAYTVTFKVVKGAWNDGSKANKTVKLSGYSGDTLKLMKTQIPTAGGKPAKGYKAGSWNKTPSTSAAIKGNVTYTYTYTAKPAVKVKVAFKANGGAGAMSAKSVAKGARIKLSANKFKRTGYTFAGWNTKKNGSGKAYKNEATVKVDAKLVLYAQWKKASPKVSGTLLAKMKSKGKDGLAISWTKVKGADGYDIFFSRCNHDGKEIVPKKVKTVKGNAARAWTKTGLKPGVSHKVYIRAYVLKNGKKRYVKRSPLTHAYTSGGSSHCANAKSVAVNKSALTLGKGKAAALKADVEVLQAGKLLMPDVHVPTLRFKSTNGKVATVTKSGKVTGKKTGSCYVYVYAHNGVSAKVKVTVR